MDVANDTFSLLTRPRFLHARKITFRSQSLDRAVVLPVINEHGNALGITRSMTAVTSLSRTEQRCDRRRILFLVRRLDGGGAERQLLLLAGELQKREYDVTLAAYYSGGVYDQYVAETGVRFVCLNKGGLRRNVRFFRRALRLVQALDPDVIHGYMDTGNIVASALKPFARRSLIVWGVRVSELDLSYYDVAGRLLSHLTRLVSGSADLIICNSRSGANDAIRAGYPRGKIAVVPNGIDVHRFSPAPERAKKLRLEWGVAKNEFLIGLVGRLHPMKGHATFIAAAKILSERRNDVRFVCLGDGVEPHRSKILDLLASAGLGDRLLVRSFSHEINAVYTALDVSTSSSLFGEGFSNSIAESMACGTPCVVTDVGDSRLIVSGLGVVVSPQDPVELAAGWEKVLSRTGPSLSTSCRERIARTFTVDNLTDATIQALRLARLPDEPTAVSEARRG